MLYKIILTKLKAKTDKISIQIQSHDQANQPTLSAANPVIRW